MAKAEDRAIKASSIICPHCGSQEGFCITTLEEVSQVWDPHSGWHADHKGEDTIHSIVSGTCLACKRDVPYALLTGIVYDYIDYGS